MHAASHPALDGIRLSVHVLAATVWVGGQITMAGLVPTARGLGEGAPRALARAFGRMQWPAYALLVVTGLWNVSAVHAGQPHAWAVVLVVKIVVVALAGLAAFLHTRAVDHARSRRLGCPRHPVVARRPGHGGLPRRMSRRRPGTTEGSAVRPDHRRSNLVGDDFAR